MPNIGQETIKSSERSLIWSKNRGSKFEAKFMQRLMEVLYSRKLNGFTMSLYKRKEVNRPAQTMR